MGKGIVKSTRPSVVPPATAETIGGTQGATRGIPLLEGSIQDNADPTQEIEFFQPYGTELGIEVGSKVQYNTILLNGKPVINMVRLVEKGAIETLNANNDGGTLMDKGTKKSIPFSHMYCRETGLVAPGGSTKGSTVSFERVIDPTTGEITATAIELIK